MRGLQTAGRIAASWHQACKDSWVEFRVYKPANANEWECTHMADSNMPNPCPPHLELGSHVPDVTLLGVAGLLGMLCQILHMSGTGED